MEKESEHGAFDRLVAGLNSDERKALLEKLKGISETSNVPEFQIHEDIRTDISNISIKLKNESIFYYIFLWFRSIFAQQRIEKIYNDDLVAAIARTVNRRCSSVIDYPRELLCSPFYNFIRDLKDCADFFRPYVSIVSDYPGEFYVFLSAYITPEIAAEIKKEADPYTIPFEREILSDTKLQKIRSLESVLRSISAESRAKLYDAAKRVEWLGQFSMLPYIHFVAQFTDVTGNSFTCPFDNAKIDFPVFARVFSDAYSVPVEILEALFLFYRKKNTAYLVSDVTIENAMREFLAEASDKFSKIHSFASVISMNNLGQVVFHSYDWQAEKFGGAEDWFQKFCDEWKHIFNEQWESWLRDKKKSKLVALLRMQFGIDSFPELPYRPWTQIWDGVSFNGELTGGFLVWFCKNRLPSIVEILNILLFEGVFVNNENRSELADDMDCFKSVMVRLEQFVSSISQNGAYGSVFAKLMREDNRTLQAQSKIESVILSAAAQIHELNKLFCNCCRSLELVLSGILDEKKKSGYSGLQNRASIRGTDNNNFIEKLGDVRMKLAETLSLLSELEPLDLPRYGSRK